MEVNECSVQYSIDLSNRRAHLYIVTMTMDGAWPKQRLSLPVWTPGSYMVRDFAQHIVEIKAFERKSPIEIEKTNKNTFLVHNSGPSIFIVYHVYAFDSSIRSAFIDDTQAFFNGTALFLRPHDRENARYVVNLKKPGDKNGSSHEVATTMPILDVDDMGFGSYEARSYQELVDYPVQISAMTRLPFEVGRIPHEMTLVGDVRPFDETRLQNDLGKLCEQHLKLFGKTTPFQRYLFIGRFEEGGHGGLEHRNSSMLLASPYSLPKPGLCEPDSNYRNFLSLCSHEYFHAWNVKHLKPYNFSSYDFDHECYTTMLWIFEGLTSYYDDLLVRRAGLMSVASYLELLGKNYNRLLRTKGRQKQSLAESSFDAWIKFYRPNENSANAGVSYYLKGSFIGLYLDLSIRSRSGHKMSLDDVMRVAAERFGGEKGITEEQFFDLLAEVGVLDTQLIKERYIYGVDEIPLKELLSEFGIDLSLVADECFLDDKTRMSAFLGFKLRFDDNDRALISFVENNSAATASGLSPGDEVVAVNDIRIDSSNCGDVFGRMRAEPQLFTFARKKLIRHCEIVPTAVPMQNCKWALSSMISSQQKSALERWLGK